MVKSKIGIIVSSTRPGRFADIPAQWLGEIVRKRDDADFELVDLRDYPMPFFEEKRPLIMLRSKAVHLRSSPRRSRNISTRRSTRPAVPAGPALFNVTWRALPERSGRWNSVWKRFDRLSRSGVFEIFFDHLAALSPSYVLSMRERDSLRNSQQLRRLKA
jgi:hypothetical protein